MKTIETNVYTFEELDEKAKEKAREWFRDGNDYTFLNEAMEEHAIGLLAKAKIKDVGEFRVFYSLSHSQGDGAMIELDATWRAWRITVKQRGHYSHERSTEITLTSLKTGEYAPDARFKDFEDNVYIPMCLALKKYGYDYIEYEDSNECIDENIIRNEYTFTIDGERF